ncbi:MAG: TatD family hydrolase [Methanobacteriaceae archaeon]|nr:TatD family hydrolase [Methanobacteriaceae archaeon]
MIDVHCHIDFPEYDDIRTDLINKTKKNLSLIVNSGTNFEGNNRVLDLQKKYPKFIKTTLGYHPLTSVKDDRKTIEETKKQIVNNLDYTQAIGEFGLDFFKQEDLKEIKKQYLIFEEMLNLASEYDMPVILHVRQAEKQAVEILEKYPSIPEVILHCYSGNVTTARQAIDNGYYLSFATLAITSKKHQKLLKKLPLTNILTETDSPYLSPVKDELNEPSNISQTIELISKINELDIEEVDKITEKNAKKALKL